MEYRLLGWPPDGPRLRLDYRAFAYAGKFVTGDSGKAVVWDESGVDPTSSYDRAVRAAASFSPDRQDADSLWIRYVDVAVDDRGRGLGSRLCRFVVDRAVERGFDAVWIAVNNPVAYHAVHKAGFGFTGEEAGLAELVCSTTAPRTRARYQAGLERFRDPDHPADADAFLEARSGEPPPPTIADPDP